MNTQVVVHLQEEGTENLSLQDEEGQFLHVIPPVPSLEGHEPPCTVFSRLRKQSYNNCLK